MNENLKIWDCKSPMKSSQKSVENLYTTIFQQERAFKGKYYPPICICVYCIIILGFHSSVVPELRNHKNTKK